MNTKIIAIVAHDAGGAEVVSSYVRQEKLKCIYAIEGPAVNVFKRKLGEIEIHCLEEAISQADWLLCGTSWQSDLEFNAIKLGRKLGKHSVSFLDHWVNYRERFERQGVINLPDEIWAGDLIAANMAKSIFTDTPVKLIDNPYFIDILRKIGNAKNEHQDRSQNLKILYVCEPIKEHALKQYGDANHWGYTEEDALRFFLDNLYILCDSVEEIVIRPHPSEKSEKYQWVKTKYNFPIVFGGMLSLVKEIVQSDVVVGCSSMAMVIGLLAGKKVISCIPPIGCNYSLPQKDIVMLRDYVNNI